MNEKLMSRMKTLDKTLKLSAGERFLLPGGDTVIIDRLNLIIGLLTLLVDIDEVKE